MLGEVSGSAGAKLLRLLYFVGAGVICAAAINRWLELERKSLQRPQQELPHQKLSNVQSPHGKDSSLSQPLE